MTFFVSIFKYLVTPFFILYINIQKGEPAPDFLKKKNTAEMILSCLTTFSEHSLPYTCDSPAGYLVD